MCNIVETTWFFSLKQITIMKAIHPVCSEGAGHVGLDLGEAVDDLEGGQAHGAVEAANHPEPEQARVGVHAG